ncbi:unnamed protein product [Leuciscus chuanchicus]
MSRGVCFLPSRLYNSHLGLISISCDESYGKTLQSESRWRDTTVADTALVSGTTTSSRIGAQGHCHHHLSFMLFAWLSITDLERVKLRYCTFCQVQTLKLVFFFNLCPACLCGVWGQKDLWACCLSRVMESSIMCHTGPHTLRLMDAVASREI